MSWWGDKLAIGLKAQDFASLEDGHLLLLKEQSRLTGKPNPALDSALQRRGYSLDDSFEAIDESFFRSVGDVPPKRTVWMAIKLPLKWLIKISVNLFLGSLLFYGVVGLFLPDVPLAAAIVLMFTAGFFYGAYRMILFGVRQSRLRKPQVLVLRPFERGNISQALKKFVLKHVGVEGHSFTLSDSYIKPNRLVQAFILVAGLISMILIAVNDAPPILGIWVVVILGMFFRNSYRVGTVRNIKDLVKLDRIVNNYKLLNTRSSTTQGTPFNIKCRVEVWKIVVIYLLYTSDLIIIDVTESGQGLEWELAQLKARDLHHKCIVVRKTDSAPIYGEGDLVPNGFVYAADGKLTEPETERLIEAMQTILGGTALRAKPA